MIAVYENSMTDMKDNLVVWDTKWHTILFLKKILTGYVVYMTKIIFLPYLLQSGIMVLVPAPNFKALLSLEDMYIR